MSARADYPVIVDIADSRRSWGWFLFFEISLLLLGNAWIGFAVFGMLLLIAKIISQDVNIWSCRRRLERHEDRQRSLTISTR